MPELLSDEEIEAQLPDGWDRDGDEITRTFEFDGYFEGVGFASGVGGLAEEAFHHPKLIVEWGEVEVRLTTHSEGGITNYDVDLAERVNDIYE
jgi:4a-hydroxytetrahydrobiopterin dehydratase